MTAPSARFKKFYQKPLITGLSVVIGLLASIGEALSKPEDSYVEGEVLVTFKAGVELGGAKAALSRRSFQLDRHYERTSRQRGRVSGLVRDGGTTQKLIEDLKQDPNVESVEPNYIRHVSSVSSPTDPGFSQLWGLKNTGQTVNGVGGTSGVDVKFLEAWKLARDTSAEVVVAVIDTGLDITHPDLVGNLWTNPGEIAGNSADDDANGYIDDIHGFDFSSNTASMTDSGDHGTHVCGTIGATGNNAAGIIGVQYRAKILPLKASNNGDSLSTSAVIDAYEYAIALKQRGVNIVAINASFGGSSYSSTELAAIRSLGDAGIVLCAAAGNDGANNDSTASYPSNYDVPNVISVAAISQTNQLASYSNFGATSVDIAAPGSNIYSTLPLSELPRTISLKVGSTTYSAARLEYSGDTATAGLSGQIHTCGIGNASDFHGGVSGNIALTQRGTITFSQKVTNAMNAGAAAVVIYDNTADSLNVNPWTLGSPGSWIPVLRITGASGQALAALSLPASATVINSVETSSAYQFLSGTSMATPHVTGAIAFAAWNFPGESATQRISRILGQVTAVSALAGKVKTGGRLDLLKTVDTDGDNLPDWWETENFGELARTSTMDSDSDGFSNRLEFLAATSPVDPGSRLAISAITRGSGTSAADFTLTFPTVSGRRYQVQRSDDLQDWGTLGSTIEGTGAAAEVTDSGALHESSGRYYRMRLLDE